MPSFEEYVNHRHPGRAVIVGEVVGPSTNRILNPAWHLRNFNYPAGINHVITPVLVHYIIFQGEAITNISVGEIVDVLEGYYHITPETRQYHAGDPRYTAGDIAISLSWPMEAGNRYLIILHNGANDPSGMYSYNGEVVLSAMRREQVYRLSQIAPAFDAIHAPPHYPQWHQSAMAMYGHLYHTLPATPPPPPLPQAISPEEISIITQGFRDVDIHDSSGNLLIRDGRGIYRENPQGGRTQVGQRIPISQAMRRFHYVLDLDEYTFGNMIFTQGIDTEISITTSADWMIDSLVRFEDFAGSNHLELRVSPAVANLSNTVTRMVIEPSEVASPAELRRLNAER